MNYKYFLVFPIFIWSIGCGEKEKEEYNPKPLENDGIVKVDDLYEEDALYQEFIADIDPLSMDDIPSWNQSFSYKNVGWKDLKLRMYEGSGSSSHKPSIVFFHGGGWKDRAHNQHKQYAYYFAQKGFNTFSVEYRVLSDQDSVTIFDAVEDTKSAFRYLRENAEELKINPDKLIGAGMSAGGHLVATAAFVKEYDHQDEDLNISSIPNGLIIQNGTIDLSEHGNKVGHGLLSDNWKKLSPLHHISDCENVPALTLIGENDNIVPYKATEAWDSIYQSKGCSSQFYKFLDRTHGFANYNTKKSGPEHRDFYHNIYFINKFLSDHDFTPH